MIPGEGLVWDLHISDFDCEYWGGGACLLKVPCSWSGSRLGCCALPGLESTKEGPSRLGQEGHAGPHGLSLRKHLQQSLVQASPCPGDTGESCGHRHMEIEVCYGPCPYTEKRVIK